MSVLLIPSIALMLTATVWSIFVWRTARDHRLLLLTILLMLMSARRIITLVDGVRTRGLQFNTNAIDVPEFVALVIAVLALCVVIFLHRYVAGRAPGDRAMRLLRSALADSADAMLLTDAPQSGAPARGRIVFVNNAFCRLMGFTAEELIHQTPDMLRSPLAPEQQVDVIERGLLSGVPFLSRSVNRRSDGTDFSALWSVSPVRNAAGAITHHLSILRDVSELHRAEQRLERAKEIYERLINGVNAIAWEMALPEWQFTFVSEAGQRILGYPLSEWLTPGFWPRHLHPEDYEHAMAYCQSQTQAGADHTFSYRMIAADGRVVWLEDVVTIVKEGGRTVGLRGVMIDVTERRIAEEAIRRGHERYHALVDAAATGYVVVDHEGVVIEANAEYARLAGRDSPEDVLGRSVIDWTAPHDLERNAQAVAECARVGYTRGFEVDYLLPDGTFRPIEVNASRLPDSNGQGVIIALCRDITTRRAAEIELRENRDRFDQIAHAIDQAFWLLQFEPLRILYVSPAFERVCGLSDEAAYADPLSWVELVHPDDRERVAAAFDAWVRDPEHARYDEEYRIVRPDTGAVRWVHDRGHSVQRENGRPVRGAGIAADITPKKLAENRLRTSEQRLARMIHHTPLAVIVWGTDFTINEWNPAAEGIFGWKASEVIGRRGEFLIPQQVQPYVADIWDKLLSRSGGGRGSNENITRDGRIITCEWYNSPLLDEQGRLTGIISLCEDITDRRAAERRQATLMMELDHRVKNNLATILAMAEQTLAVSTDVDQFAAAFVGRLRAMSRMHEMLAGSRWESVDLRRMIESSIEAFMLGPAPQIKLDGPSVQLPSRIANALNLALHELATNAAKHGALSTPSGCVGVRWTYEGEPGNGLLSLHWLESGGPPVSPPKRRGFGSDLIEGVINYELGGHADIAYHPDGVRVDLTVSINPTTARAKMPRVAPAPI